MIFPSIKELNTMWSNHNLQWRDSTQICSQWKDASLIDRNLLRYTVNGDWWDILAKNKITLLITREYEHLVIAICVIDNEPVISYMPMPHPSGLVVDRNNCTVYIASTRNPNQVYDLMPISRLTPRLDIKGEPLTGNPLIPMRSRFFPGCLYMHDLALINGKLHANAVGENAIVRLYDNGRYERVWWPKCIEGNDGPVFGQNHIQLNSIASGSDIRNSYFSASIDKLSARRPGHKNFPVDKRGVIFSGKTRMPVARGLTRPHSARLLNGQLWVDNSGYGEFGLIDNSQFISVTQLPGWTRGLSFYKRIAFVGTSRVIPRFRQYAPGLDVDKSFCGVHAVDSKSGKVLGSLLWPYGNQIFSIDWISNRQTTGFPFSIKKRANAREKKLFYTFKTPNLKERKGNE